MKTLLCRCVLRSCRRVSCRPSGDGEVGRRHPTLSRANRGSGCPFLPRRPLHPRGRRLPPPSVRSVARSRLPSLKTKDAECRIRVSSDRVPPGHNSFPPPSLNAGQHQPPQTERLRVQRKRSTAVGYLQRSQTEESGRGQ